MSTPVWVTLALTAPLWIYVISGHIKAQRESKRLAAQANRFAWETALATARITAFGRRIAEARTPAELREIMADGPR